MKEAKSIQFNLTDNPWINNGLVRLYIELKKEYPKGKEMELLESSLKIYEEKLNDVDEEKRIMGTFSNILHNLASKGTYNFHSNLKRLNKYANANYSHKKEYPESREERNEKINDIPLNQRKLVEKETGYNNLKRHQKIWVKRNSYYLSSNVRYAFDNYRKRGLDFDDSEEYELLKKEFYSKNNKNEVCPICGHKSTKLTESKSYQNPLTSEHHNNLGEGFSSDMRRNLRGCPKCLFCSLVSVFDSYIPFFSTENEVYLALPKTQNLNTLEKINNNLSIDGQYIDFNKPSTIGYGTNIKSLPYRSKSASILALLHNIKNKYRKTEKDIEQLLDFEEIKKEEFAKLTDWVLFTKSYKFETISSSKNIYKLLEKEELGTGEEIYFVPDLLSNFKMKGSDENIIEKFYRSILKLKIDDFSETLFHLTKKYTQDKSIFRKRGLGYALFLWKNHFLDKILEVSINMDQETKKACKEIAKSIGKNFKEDVGVLTKFAYASGPKEFKEALEDSAFRLAKMSSDRENSNVFVDDESLQQVFDILEEKENFDDFKNYFVSFMSIYVISANYTPKENGDENE